MQIREYLDKCRPKMQQLIKNADDVSLLLPLWTNENAVPALAKHISNLKIPSTHGGQPSLLLHNLGEEKSRADSERFERITEILSPDYHTCVLPHSALFSSI